MFFVQGGWVSSVFPGENVNSLLLQLTISALSEVDPPITEVIHCSETSTLPYRPYHV